VARCFLSYSHTPLDQSALRQVREILSEAGVSYWFDGRLQNQQGGALNSEIASEILAAEVIVAIASSQYVSSTYCQAEVIFALERDKQLLRVNAEPYELPPALLPLASRPAVNCFGVETQEFARGFVAALARYGIDASGALASASPAHGYSNFDQPDAALIRPAYSVLKSTPPSALLDIERRLIHAQAANPQNGYNHLSLAFLWLFKGDAGRALEAARKAAGLLGNQPDAHFAEALALCGAERPKQRSREEVENILRRLAIARRLPKAGAHIDLLSAIVIANYYLPNYLTPPAAPGDLLQRGMSAGVLFNKDEVLRVLDTEPVLDVQHLPGLEAYIQAAGS
jgi:hypothetical protein